MKKMLRVKYERLLSEARSFKKGFTLIELLVVVAIIALLASIILASLSSARSKARDARRIADMKSLQTAVEGYISDHGGGLNGSGAALPPPPYTATNGCGLGHLVLATAAYGISDCLSTDASSFGCSNADGKGKCGTQGAASTKYISSIPKDPGFTTATDYFYEVGIGGTGASNIHYCIGALMENSCNGATSCAGAAGVAKMDEPTVNTVGGYKGTLCFVGN